MGVVIRSQSNSNKANSMKVTFFKLLALCAIFSPLTAITGKAKKLLIKTNKGLFR